MAHTSCAYLVWWCPTPSNGHSLLQAFQERLHRNAFWLSFGSETYHTNDGTSNLLSNCGLWMSIYIDHLILMS